MSLDNNDWRDTLKNITGLPETAPDEGTEMQPPKPTAAKSRLDIILDRKGRAGKTATIIAGFLPGTPDADIAAIAARLKSRLGTGGSARGGEILIQGDRRTDAQRLLTELGYRTRMI